MTISFITSFFEQKRCAFAVLLSEFDLSLFSLIVFPSFDGFFLKADLNAFRH